MKAIIPITLLLALALCSCVNMGPNDGLVPRMSAQANLPYSVDVAPTGTLRAQFAAPMGQTVNPLNETRKSYWSTP